MRARGMSFVDIALHFGIAPETARRWVDDEYRTRSNVASRRWKERSRRLCPFCRVNMHRHETEVCRTCSIEQRRYWTRERIIASMHEWEAEYGHQPSARNWLIDNAGTQYPSCTVVQKIFGSWSAGIKAAGFTPLPSGTPQKWSDEEILEAIRDHARMHGEFPRLNEWKHRAEHRPTQACVAQRFGTWNTAIAAAGFTPRPQGRH